MTIGKFSVTDIFSNNQYAHDPKNDFLNWAAIDAGTFDYAADAWGYTVGAALEWSVKVHGSLGSACSISPMCRTARISSLDSTNSNTIIEVEKGLKIGGQPGKLRLTAFDSRGRMGLLNQAVALAASTDTPVDIASVRRYRDRLGADLSLEQQLATNL